MLSTSNRRLPLSLLLAVVLLPLPLAAQQFPGFGGFEGRVGFASPHELDTGLSVSMDANLGYIGITLLRTVAGFNYFAADVTERDFAGRPVSGSLTGVGGRVGVRLDLLGGAAISPFATATLTGHRVTVDAAEEQDRRDLDREFGGFLVGASPGVGVSYALDQERRFRAVVEARRVFMTNTPHWAAEAGVRMMVRGRNAYTRVPRFPPYWPPRAVGLTATTVEPAASGERPVQEQEHTVPVRVRVEE